MADRVLLIEEGKIWPRCRRRYSAAAADRIGQAGPELEAEVLNRVMKRGKERIGAALIEPRLIPPEDRPGDAAAVGATVLRL
ncbi:Uncharacterised protein [Raoultella ornithinolytica]|nr:Uncharacterised protein [Raoultella ornithinolytica]